jgi:hypothetical protein
MLCMPEFDTYKAIERYAKDNSSPEAILGFQMLRKRTETTIMWRTVLTGLDISAALKMYLGISDRAAGSKKLEDMTEEERRKAYAAACMSTGIQLDPETFKK